MAKKNKTTTPTSRQGVRVRMYRQGLGDCFLLSFPGKGSSPVHIVIDCGVCKGAKNASANMQAVVADIASETGSAIDVLVTTHQHWDHLSGFEQAREAWDRIRIGELWMAWTEKPGDKVAEAVLEKLGKKKTTVERTAKRMAMSAGLHVNGDQCDRIDGLLGFHGLGLAANGGGPKLEDIYARLKARVPAKNRKYLMPHTVIGHPRLPGTNIFVLGPPRDVELVGKSDPTGKKPEVYPDAGRVIGFTDAGTDMDPDFVGPFAPQVGIPMAQPPAARSGSMPQAQTRGRAKVDYQEAFARYFPTLLDAPGGLAWRELNTDSFSELEHLAMALVNDTNNTSLVLAFQLPDGRVLLFPGDAQVGNCLSWHEKDWTVRGKKVTATDLLKNTVLYKVSHHASHNGTLREKGLELMVHPDLIALVPLEVSQASLLGYGRTMPWPSLVDRLKERTRGRLLLSDSKHKAPSDSDLRNLRPGERAAFATASRITDLFIDIVL